MLDTTPTQPGFLHLRSGSPSCLMLRLRFAHSPVSGFPLRASVSSYLIAAQASDGPPKFLCASLHTCHGLRTPPVLHILAIGQNVGSSLSSLFLTGFPSVPQYPHLILPLTDGLVLPSVHVKTLGDRNKLISKLCQLFRERDLPCGLHDSLCTLHLLCSPVSRLRRRRNTRYGWMADPYPAGTFTLQDAPSFAWRANAKAEGRRTFCGVPLQRLVVCRTRHVF